MELRRDGVRTVLVCWAGLMLDGRPLIDVHLHPPTGPGLKLPWDVWVQDFDSPD